MRVTTKTRGNFAMKARMTFCIRGNEPKESRAGRALNDNDGKKNGPLCTNKGLIPAIHSIRREATIRKVGQNCLSEEGLPLCTFFECGCLALAGHPKTLLSQMCYLCLPTSHVLRIRPGYRSAHRAAFVRQPALPSRPGRIPVVSACLLLSVRCRPRRVRYPTTAHIVDTRSGYCPFNAR